MAQQTVVFTGGGTGGHVYPAIAVAKALQSQNPELKIHFIGSSEGIETKIVPREGYDIDVVRVGRLNNVSKWRKIKTLLLLPFSILHSMLLLWKIKPAWVMGVGGFASGPVMFAAWLMRVPLYFWEGNAFPGLANRIVAKLADAGFFVFEEAVPRIPCRNPEVFGMPVRQSIEEIQITEKDVELPLKILVFGGSLGARAINTVIMQAVQHGGPWLDQVKIVHQTGRLDYNRISQTYDDLKAHGFANNVECYEFLHDMDSRYQWADIAVCRGGASTLSELAACGKASLVIPFPYAADNHQQKNAEALVDAGAAHMCVQDDFNVEYFIGFVEKLLANPQALKGLEKNIKSFHRPAAASKMATYLIDRMNP